jgi:hypothetical protein
LYIYDTTNLSRKTQSGSAFGDQIGAFDWPFSGIEEIATCTHGGKIEIFTVNPDLSGTSKATRAPPEIPDEGAISKVVQMFWWNKDRVFLAALCGPEESEALGYYFMVHLNPATAPSHSIAGSLDATTGYVLTSSISHLKLLVIFSAQSITEELIGFSMETNQWLNVTCNDDGHMTLPEDDTRDNGTAAAIGLALDRSSKKPIPSSAAGEPDLAPVPILLLLTSSGKVLPFHVIDGKNKQKSPASMVSNILQLPAAPVQRNVAGASTTSAAANPRSNGPAPAGFRPGDFGGFGATPTAAQAPPAQPAFGGIGLPSTQPTSFSISGAPKKEPSSLAPAVTSPVASEVRAAPTGFGIQGSSFAPAKSAAASTASSAAISFSGAAPKSNTAVAPGFGIGGGPSTTAPSGGALTSFGSIGAAAPLAGSAKAAASPSLRASGSIPAETPSRPSAAFPALSAQPVSPVSVPLAAQKAPAPQPTLPVESSPKMPAPVSPVSVAPQPTRAAPLSVASTPVAAAKQAPPPAASSAAAAAAKTVAAQFTEEVKSFTEDLRQMHAFAVEIEQIMAEAASADPEKKTKFRLRDFERLVQHTVGLRRHYATVAAEYESAHKELNSVKQMYIESITERAEAKSQMEMRDNPHYLRLVQKRQLDPEARGLRAKMHDATLRVETALHQVEEQLTSIHNEKHRATVKGGKQPHIKLLSHHLSYKDKPIAGDEFIVQRPSWETLWATLRQNVQIIRSQQGRVTEMSQSLNRLRRAKPNKLVRDRPRASPNFKRPVALPSSPMRQAPVYDPEERKIRAEDRKRRNKRLSLFKEVITEAATGPDRWISVRKQSYVPYVVLFLFSTSLTHSLSEFEADQTLSLQEEKDRKREQDSKRLAEREAERARAVSAMQPSSTPNSTATTASAKSTPISVYYTSSFPGTEKPAPATPSSPSTMSQPGTPSNIATPVPKPAIPAPTPVPMTAGRPSLSALTSSPVSGVSGLLVPPTKLPGLNLNNSMLGESMFGSEQDDTPAASAARSTANVSKALANLTSSASPTPASPAPIASLSFASATASPASPVPQLSPTKSNKSKMGKVGISGPGEFAFGASAPQRSSLSLSQSLQPESEDDEGSFSESEDSQEDPASPKKPVVKQTAAAGLAKFSVSTPSTSTAPSAASVAVTTVPAAAKASPPATFGGFGFSGSGPTAAPAAAKAPTAMSAGFGLGALGALSSAAVAAKPGETAKPPLSFGAPAPTVVAPSGAAKKLDFGASGVAKPAASVAAAPAPVPVPAPAKSANSITKSLLPESDNEEDEEDPEDYSGDEDDPNATQYEDDEYGQEEFSGGEEEEDETDDGELTRPSSPDGDEGAEEPQPLKVIVKNTAVPSAGLRASTGTGVAPASAFGSMLGAPAKATAPAPTSAAASGFGTGFGAASAAKQPAPAPSAGFASFGGAPPKSAAPVPASPAPTGFGGGFGVSTPNATAPAATTSAPTGFGGGFGVPSGGAATTGTSSFGSSFSTAPAKPTGAATSAAAPVPFGGTNTSTGFGGAVASPTAATAAPSAGKFGLGGLSMGGGFQTAAPSQSAPVNSFAGSSANKPGGSFGGSGLGASPSGGFGQPAQLGSAAPSGFGGAGARSPPSGAPAAFGGGAASFGQTSGLGASPSSGFGAGSSAMGSGFGAGSSQLGGGHAAAAAAMMPQGQQRPMGGGGGTGGFGAIAGGGGGGFGGAPSSGGFGGMAGGQQQSGFGNPGGAAQWTQARK